MSRSKNLSNPFSTGGGGSYFEAQVQALFVVLMLSGGRAPCFPHWPIAAINLQSKIDGFDTDDLVVVVENPNNKEQRKLLCQVKHSIAITKRSVLFKEVIQAAWNDFNNPKVFKRNKDFIATVTGPLSKSDLHNVQWLLSQAKHTKDVDEFFMHVHRANFSPSKSGEKLEAIQCHLKAANCDNEVARVEVYEFLKRFHILSYDLSSESSTNLSLLLSHISQFQQSEPHMIWSEVVNFVQDWNQAGGTITPKNLPENLLEIFKQKPVEIMPEAFKATQDKPIDDWTQHPDATYLALATLIGTWNEKSQCDRETITKLLGISYDEWLNKAREVVHSPNSPLSLKNGIWKVVNRVELLSQLGSRILDQDLDSFKSLAISVLTESDPVFELPIEQRYAASIHGKVLECSHDMRNGIADGLAILSNMPDACSKCSQGKVETTCSLILHELLFDADWIRWGSLNRLLPTLAEVAPSKFLDAADQALKLEFCPFDDLFSQEGNAITGGTHITGLLWALESLAWDEINLVRVCTVLGELASRDPGGQWANRPSNSLVTILLPWFPQTLASVDKRKVAVLTLLREWPGIAWNLIIQLLPDQHLASSGSHKPSWRMTILENREHSVKHEEYWQQVSNYAEFAVGIAEDDIDRLSELIDHIDNLPQPAINRLIEFLASDSISALREQQRLSIWNRLKKFTIKHRKYFDKNWALPEDLLVRLELVSGQLAPTNPLYRYQYLFTGHDFELYENDSDWVEQDKKLDTLRKKAISEIYHNNGIKGVFRFAETVASPKQVGHALGAFADDVIERALLPQFLDTPDKNYKELTSGFISRRYHINNWQWCNNIDKSRWTPVQKGQFLAYLPFTKETWDGVSNWLREDESEYWVRTVFNPYQANSDLIVAVEKLIEHTTDHVRQSIA